MSTDTEIRDAADEQRFVYVEDGHEAELTYEVEGDRLILTHTGVPEALGGRGIGGRLVAAALARAVDRGETLVPWCPYARGWLEKHPDEAAAATIDWTPPPERS